MCVCVCVSLMNAADTDAEDAGVRIEVVTSSSIVVSGVVDLL